MNTPSTKEEPKTKEQQSAQSFLIVDDSAPLRTQLARAMTRRGFEVTEAANFEEAIQAAQTKKFDKALLDLKMPGKNGLELLGELLKIQPNVQAVMLTAYGSIATAIEAIRLGAVNFVPKPADADDVLAAFEKGAAPPLSVTEQQYQAPTLARTEWEHISRVLNDCGGNITQAAKRLGIHRRTLQRKLSTFPPST